MIIFCAIQDGLALDTLFGWSGRIELDAPGPVLVATLANPEGDRFI
jgi:hypothetical protein